MKPSRSLLFLCALWILIFILPFPRHQAVSDWGQILLRHEPPVPRSIYGQQPDGDNEDLPLPPKIVNVSGLKVEAKWKPILERYPNERKVWLDAVLSTPYYGGINIYTQVAYDKAQDWQSQNYSALAKRFPGDSVLEALAISNVTPRMNSRHPGPSNSTVASWSVSLTDKWAPPNRKLWDSYRQRAIAGQKREPNNVFWWWLELRCALNARRDAEIWPILQAGSTKTDFDDHLKEVGLWRLEARQLTNGPLSAPEIADTRNYPQGAFSAFRQACREVMEDAIGQRLQGHHKQALEGTWHLVQMSRTLCVKSNSYIGFLVGQACETIAMNGPALRIIVNPKIGAGAAAIPTPIPVPGAPAPGLPPGSVAAPAPPPSPYSPPPRPRLGSTVGAFASDFGSLSFYAHQLGRRDIERQVNQEWIRAGRRYLASRKMSSTLIASLNDNVIAVATLLDNFGTIMLRGLPVLAILGLIFWGLQRNSRTRRILGFESGAVVSLPRWFTALTFCFVILLFLLAASVTRLLVDSGVFDSSNSSVTTQIASQDWSYFTMGSRYLDDIPAWTFGFPASVMLLAAFWIATAQQRKDNGRASLKERLKKLLTEPEHGLARFDLAPVMFLCGAMAYWTIVLGFLLVFIGNAMTNAGDFSLFDPLCLFFFCALCFAPRLSIWYRLKRRRFTLVRWNYYARQFMMTYAVVVSVLYFSLCLFGWWAAIRTETVTRQNLHDGEMKALRKSLGL